MSDSSYSPSPESDTLARLQHEATKDPEFVQSLNASLPSFSGQQVKEWRKATPVRKTPNKALTNVDMEKAFPSVHGPSKPKLNRWEAHQVRRQTMTRSKAKRKEAESSSSESVMGLFELLPGELRNLIYRLAFVPSPEHQPVLITGTREYTYVDNMMTRPIVAYINSDLICGTGACAHKQASRAAPAIASTCRQIRGELMPIFCAENEFRFNEGMVRNRCGGNWVRSMDGYATMIRKVVLEVSVLLRNPITRVVESLIGEVTVECPAGRTDGRFEVSFNATIPEEKAESCKLGKLVTKLNDNAELEVAKKLARIVASDELAELVFRCKK